MFPALALKYFNSDEAHDGLQIFGNVLLLYREGPSSYVRVVEFT